MNVFQAHTATAITITTSILTPLFDSQIIYHLLVFFLTQINGGESGIRTHDRVNPIHALQACALNRSAISPFSKIILIKTK